MTDDDNAFAIGEMIVQVDEQDMHANPLDFTALHSNQTDLNIDQIDPSVFINDDDGRNRRVEDQEISSTYRSNSEYDGQTPKIYDPESPQPYRHESFTAGYEVHQSHPALYPVSYQPAYGTPFPSYPVSCHSIEYDYSQSPFQQMFYGRIFDPQLSLPNNLVNLSMSNVADRYKLNLSQNVFPPIFESYLGSGLVSQSHPSVNRNEMTSDIASSISTDIASSISTDIASSISTDIANDYSNKCLNVDFNQSAAENENAAENAKLSFVSVQPNVYSEFSDPNPKEESFADEDIFENKNDVICKDEDEIDSNELLHSLDSNNNSCQVKGSGSITTDNHKDILKENFENLYLKPKRKRPGRYRKCKSLLKKKDSSGLFLQSIKPKSKICTGTKSSEASGTKISKQGSLFFQCRLCEYSSNNKSNFRNHLFIHSDERRFACPCCPYKGKQSAGLRAHLKVHSVEKPYNCLYCPYKCKRKQNLIQHLRIHSSCRPFQCSTCSYRTTTKQALQKHCCRHRKSYKEELQNDLSKHKESICKSSEVTQKTISNTDVAVEETPLSCNICNYECKKKEDMDNHSKGHLEENEVSSTQENHTIKNVDNESSNSLLCCPNCSFTTTRKCALGNHVKTHIRDCYRCPLCSFKSNLAGSFRIHLNTHSKSNMLKCVFCEFNTNSSDLFVIHMKKHKKKKITSNYKIDLQPSLSLSYSFYQCPYCAYDCLIFSAFKLHIINHSKADFQTFKRPSNNITKSVQTDFDISDSSMGPTGISLDSNQEMEVANCSEFLKNFELPKKVHDKKLRYKRLSNSSLKSGRQKILRTCKFEKGTPKQGCQNNKNSDGLPVNEKSNLYTSKSQELDMNNLNGVISKDIFFGLEQTVNFNSKHLIDKAKRQPFNSNSVLKLCHLEEEDTFQSRNKTLRPKNRSRINLRSSTTPESMKRIICAMQTVHLKEAETINVPLEKKHCLKQVCIKINKNETERIKKQLDLGVSCDNALKNGDSCFSKPDAIKSYIRDPIFKIPSNYNGVDTSLQTNLPQNSMVVSKEKNYFSEFNVSTYCSLSGIEYNTKREHLAIFEANLNKNILFKDKETMNNIKHFLDFPKHRPIHDKNKIGFCNSTSDVEENKIECQDKQEEQCSFEYNKIDHAKQADYVLSPEFCSLMKNTDHKIGSANRNNSKSFPICNEQNNANASSDIMSCEGPEKNVANNNKIYGVMELAEEEIDVNELQSSSHIIDCLDNEICVSNGIKLSVCVNSTNKIPVPVIDNINSEHSNGENEFTGQEIKSSTKDSLNCCNINNTDHQADSASSNKLTYKTHSNSGIKENSVINNEAAIHETMLRNNLENEPVSFCSPDIDCYQNLNNLTSSKEINLHQSGKEEMECINEIQLTKKNVNLTSGNHEDVKEEISMGTGSINTEKEFQPCSSVIKLYNCNREVDESGSQQSILRDMGTNNFGKSLLIEETSPEKLDFICDKDKSIEFNISNVGFSMNNEKTFDGVDITNISSEFPALKDNLDCYKVEENVPQSTEISHELESPYDAKNSYLLANNSKFSSQKLKLSEKLTRRMVNKPYDVLNKSLSILGNFKSASPLLEKCLSTGFNPYYELGTISDWSLVKTNTNKCEDEQNKLQEEDQLTRVLEENKNCMLQTSSNNCVSSNIFTVVSTSAPDAITINHSDQNPFVHQKVSPPSMRSSTNPDQFSELHAELVMNSNFNLEKHNSTYIAAGNVYPSSQHFQCETRDQSSINEQVSPYCSASIDNQAVECLNSNIQNENNKVDLLFNKKSDGCSSELLEANSSIECNLSQEPSEFQLQTMQCTKNNVTATIPISSPIQTKVPKIGAGVIKFLKASEKSLGQITSRRFNSLKRSNTFQCNLDSIPPLELFKVSSSGSSTITSKVSDCDLITVSSQFSKNRFPKSISEPHFSRTSDIINSSKSKLNSGSIAENHRPSQEKCLEYSPISHDDTKILSITVAQDDQLEVVEENVVREPTDNCQNVMKRNNDSTNLKSDKCLIYGSSYNFNFESSPELVIYSPPGDVVDSSPKDTSMDPLEEIVVDSYDVLESRPSGQPHASENQGSSKYCCHLCSKSYVRKTSLITHWKTHEKSVFSCSLCSFTCWEKQILREHMMTNHEGKRHYNCTKCNFSSTRKCTLMSHAKVHSGEYLHCEMCEFSTKSKSELDEHYYGHKKKYECSLCSFVCCNTKDLYEHNSSSHMKRHQCTECSFKAHNLKEINEHRAAVHAKVLIKCHNCNYETNSALFLKFHMKKHAKDNIFLSCKECKYVASSKLDLYNHSSTHFTKYDYKCVFCDSVFSDSSAIREHLFTVHSIKK